MHRHAATKPQHPELTALQQRCGSVPEPSLEQNEHKVRTGRVDKSDKKNTHPAVDRTTWAPQPRSQQKRGPPIQVMNELDDRRLGQWAKCKYPRPTLSTLCSRLGAMF